ncbi:MAG: PP2C family protein-serine/threonine phosphatase [Candidatus Xenobia bacterium]
MLNLEKLFNAVDTAAPIAGVEVIAAALADEVNAFEVSFLIADFSGHSLVRLSHTDRHRGDGSLSRERAQNVPIEESPQGQALAAQQIVMREEHGATWLFAPVSLRGEAVGVLEMCFGEEPEQAVLECVTVAAHVLAYVLIANRRLTDVFEGGQRSLPLTLAAEIQHRLLPGSYSCEATEFTLAGWLEPAGNIGGDTFDFSLARDMVHISITDAMGHDLESSLLASVFVGALRNSRRRGHSLIEQANVANRDLTRYSAGNAFVTGQIVRVSLASGKLILVNGGHPSPILVRDGVATIIDLSADLPFGIDKESHYQVQEFQLAAGDRVVFLTDGMLERNAESVDVRDIMVAYRHLHPRQAVQALTHAVYAAYGGKLKDDATALCLDWNGGL